MADDEVLKDLTFTNPVKCPEKRNCNAGSTISASDQ
jgi:hypothetical protein